MSRTAAIGKTKTEKESLNPTEDFLGKRMRILRRNQGFSLKSLADRSGLNINTLSLIENGKTSPSVSTLQQLATALEIPIIRFFETEPVEKQIVFCSAGERPQVHFGNTMMEHLGKNLKDNAIQPFIVTMEPGKGSGEQSIVHTGHEFVYCLSGRIQYRIGDEIFSLEQGDSLVFLSHLPHCWNNPGSETARILLVLIPLDKSDEPGGRHFSFEIQRQEITMKVAVVSDDGKNISQHFGRAPFYIVFTIENGKVVNREVRDKLGHQNFIQEKTQEHDHEQEHDHSHGQGHGLTHGKHSRMTQAVTDCESVICGRMGIGAYESLKRLNIKPVVTDSIDPEAAVKAYIDGKLVDHTEKLH